MRPFLFNTRLHLRLLSQKPAAGVFPWGKAFHTHQPARTHMKTSKTASPAAQTAAKTAPKSPAKPKKKASRATKSSRERQQADAPTSPPEITEVEIATCAYFLYVNEGCPAGRELDHWLEAEARLRGR